MGEAAAIAKAMIALIKCAFRLVDSRGRRFDWKIDVHLENCFDVNISYSRCLAQSVINFDVFGTQFDS